MSTSMQIFFSLSLSLSLSLFHFSRLFCFGFESRFLKRTLQTAPSALAFHWHGLFSLRIVAAKKMPATRPGCFSGQFRFGSNRRTKPYLAGVLHTEQPTKAPA